MQSNLLGGIGWGILVTIISGVLVIVRSSSTGKIKNRDPVFIVFLTSLVVTVASLATTVLVSLSGAFMP